MPLSPGDRASLRVAAVFDIDAVASRRWTSARQAAVCTHDPLAPWRGADIL